MSGSADSVVLRALAGVVDALEAAWLDSVARRVAGRVWPSRHSSPRSQHAVWSRHVGATLVAGSMTALLLRPLALAPMPYTWIVPALGLCAGAAIAFAGRAPFGAVKP